VFGIGALPTAAAHASVAVIMGPRPPQPVPRRPLLPPVTEEVTAFDLPITGCMPAALNGRYSMDTQARVMYKSVRQYAPSTWPFATSKAQEASAVSPRCGTNVAHRSRGSHWPFLDHPSELRQLTTASSAGPR
jgi:hypothetical protein